MVGVILAAGKGSRMSQLPTDVNAHSLEIAAWVTRFFDDARRSAAVVGMDTKILCDDGLVLFFDRSEHASHAGH